MQYSSEIAYKTQMATSDLAAQSKLSLFLRLRIPDHHYQALGSRHHCDRATVPERLFVLSNCIKRPDVLKH